ncbi:PIG-L family deacetylase [Labedella endophytica]|uniref:PIG-L family deacetylase n=1 Tax=Labedella endophytica TaxID=1523160 RepID=UPI00140D6078|nr:PIG-L family deacetylase [Labedella endophytica]
MSLLDDIGTALVVHAHPDDETIASGGLLAELRARGVRVVLVTATRGERGEIVPGTLDPALDETELAAAREAELHGALSAIGVDEHAWLGTAPARAAGLRDRRYRDSGMEWVRPGLAGPAADAGPDAFAETSVDEQVADLLALAENVCPDAVIGYGPDGGYGHPDHVRAHVIAAAVARSVGVPFLELAHDRDPGVEWFDLEHRRTAMTDALRHHRSQVTVDGSELVHSGGQRQAIEPSVGLRPSGR